MWDVCPPCVCCLQVPWLPWAEQLQDKHTHRHRPTVHTPPQTMGFKEERKLAARMTPWQETLLGKKTHRATMAQNKEALWQPQKKESEWSITRSYAQNWDDGRARSPASRPKNVRMQGRIPTVRENRPLERRAADTAWDDTAKENQWETSKTWHWSTLYACKARREAPNWHYANVYGHSRPYGWHPSHMMSCLYAKSNIDIKIPGRSVIQKTDHTNDTTPQTQAGTVLPTWAKEKPLPLTHPKGPVPEQPSPLH